MPNFGPIPIKLNKLGSWLMKWSSHLKRNQKAHKQRLEDHLEALVMEKLNDDTFAEMTDIRI